METSMRKCAAPKRFQPVDHISELSDDVLVNILSFFTFKEAARMSVVSKRWKDLWMSVPGLNFDAAQMWEGVDGLRRFQYRVLLRQTLRPNYVNWVNKVLMSRPTNCLSGLRIRFDLDRLSTTILDNWIYYALARKVESLDLNLSNYDGIPYNLYEDLYMLSLSIGGGSRYAFPDNLLGLTNGNYPTAFPPVPLVGFKSLKSLSLKQVNVSGTVLQFFLKNCPLLENLVVHGSQTLEKLEVCDPSLALKHLEIVKCFGLDSLIVCNTNIVSFGFSTIVGNGLDTMLVLKNAPMLVDVTIVWFALVFNVYEISTYFCSFIELEKLTIKVDADALKDDDDDIIAPLPHLPNLKHLDVAVWGLKDESLLEFALILWASPNLEKFVLKSKRINKVPIRRRPSKKGKAFPLEHLKVVEIWGYFGRVAEVELVEYFVKNAVALEKVIIDPRDQPSGFTIDDTQVDNPETDAIYREVAKEQLQGLLPSHVELVLL